MLEASLQPKPPVYIRRYHPSVKNDVFVLGLVDGYLFLDRDLTCVSLRSSLDNRTWSPYQGGWLYGNADGNDQGYIGILHNRHGCLDPPDIPPPRPTMRLIQRYLRRRQLEVYSKWILWYLFDFLHKSDALHSRRPDSVLSS